MKKYINISIILIIIITLLFIPNLSLADDLGLGDLSKYGTKIDADGKILGESDRFDEIVNNIIQIIQTVGSILSVVVLIVIGIRYMLYSVDEKAEYKKTAIAYIIGCIMIFTISNILSIIYGIVKSM